CPVTAEVASSSLVVPAIFLSDIESFQVRSLHTGQAAHRVIDGLSHVRKRFRGFQILLVGDCLRIPQSLRHGIGVAGLVSYLRTVEYPQEYQPGTHRLYSEKRATNGG